ncbi:MAG TPA: type VI secretion system tip protein VgrG [Kofleriaceae bacterium]
MGVATITITSEGTPLDPAVGILAVEVRRELNRVPEATITVVDGSVAERRFAHSDTGFFEPGKSLAIAVRDGDGVDTTLFEGLVVRHAVESRPGTSSLRVELKDAAFKLTRQRKTAVFRKQADDDAIQKLIGDAGLQVGELASTQPQHEELIQFYASDWDFIVSRADAQGLVVDVDRGTISVQAMVSDAQPRATLEHGMDDVELGLEIDAGEQWAAMTGQAWDVQQQAVTAPADARSPGVTVGNLDAAAIARKLGGDSYALIHPGLVVQDELTAWATSRLTRSRLAMLRGCASIPGTPDLAPRDIVTLAGVGDRFNGDAYVSGVPHTIDHNGWRTELQLGLPPEPFARQPDIADLPAAGLLPPIHGLHVGVVDDFESDPLGEHRIKVLLSMLDHQQGAVFARVARPDAGDQRGLVFWPEPGDEVVVGFVNGDPRQAVVLGALHGSTNAPPDAAGPPSDDNTRRAIVSKAGTVIAFDDDKASVRIETPAANKVVIDDDAESITLADQHGNTITLDKNGITLRSAKDFTIDAASGKVVIQGKTVDVK